jgi:UDP-3-O-[3-hydroxymyristoyl] glucosamine N-acyltransferase LpxD
MIKIKSILEFLERQNIKFHYCGIENLEIDKFSSLDNTVSRSITWIKDVEKKSNLDHLKKNGVEDLLVVCNEFETSEYQNINYIFCSNPKEVYFTILNHVFNKEIVKNFISPKSVVETSNIGKDVYIGHNCYIGPDVSIGDNVRIKNNISIEGKVEIGDNSIISSGGIIGSDGYGYFQNEEGINIKVPHFGGVLIGKNVEIGANTCIDRGTLGDTIIGDNVKIDNLVHIAHNVVIEENVSVIALSMVAGSVLLKKNSYIAPSTSIRNQLTIGENSMVGLGAVVVKDVEDNVVVAGVPAKTIKKMETMS